MFNGEINDCSLGKSQVTCLQVSRPFHEAITPEVYASVTLSPLEVCRPSLETLRRYSSLVMALSFDAFISAEYLGAGFRNLKSLSLTNDQDSYLFKQGTGNEIMEALLKVIKENPRLSQWWFEKPYPALSAKVWEAIEGTAHRLPEVSKVERHNAQDSTATATDYSSTSVVIAPQGGSDIESGIKLQQVTPASISQEALPWATIACEKAEALLMIPAKLEPFNAILEYPDRVLPRPYAPIGHYVGLHNVYQCSSMEQLEFLSLFNQARVFPDDCVAHALKCIPRDTLEQFWWLGAQMGPLGIEALAGHFSTLREVELELTSSLEQSAYIQRIMESCPHLQVLRAGHLSVGGMRRGRPWACIGLKSLSLRFDMQEDRIEDAAGPNFYKTWNLNFQLQYGLATLSTLNRFKRLNISFTKQQMSVDGVDWMVPQVEKSAVDRREPDFE
ncbi:hypothetical protein BKA57DRAFT_507603 [Linnemannia elongata]|nr:hypothetical protein BKA57DRAFT_507603 [Linnemannia elongata]